MAIRSRYIPEKTENIEVQKYSLKQFYFVWPKTAKDFIFGIDYIFRFSVDSATAPIFAAISQAANCQSYAVPSNAGSYSKGDVSGHFRNDYFMEFIRLQADFSIKKSTSEVGPKIWQI